MRLKELIILIFILTLSFQSNGQYSSYNYTGKKYNPYLNRISLSVGVGIAAYNGELSTFFQPQLQNYYLNPAGNVGVSYRIMEYLSLRGDINAFRLYSESTGPYELDNRVFSSFNFDYSAQALFDLFPKRKIDGLYKNWNLHLFGGIGQVRFFPKDNKTGETNVGEIVNNTTSTTVTFSRVSRIYPVGIGVSHYIDKNHYISFEGNYRFTKTDYLDALQDVNHPAFDKYVTILFKYTVIFDPEPRKSLRYDKYLKSGKKKSGGN